MLHPRGPDEAAALRGTHRSGNTTQTIHGVSRQDSGDADEGAHLCTQLACLSVRLLDDVVGRMLASMERCALDAGVVLTG